MTSLPIAALILLAALSVTAAILDVRFRTVPNWLTFPALALGIAINGWAALEGTTLALLIYGLLYLLRGMGAGDVKLMAAVGALAGPFNWLVIFVITSVLGGVAAVAVVLLKRRIIETWSNLRLIFARLGTGKPPYAGHPPLDVRTNQGQRLPHALVIACAVLIVVFGLFLALPPQY